MGLLGSNAGLTDPDDVPDPPAEPVTQPGDVWLLRAAPAGVRRCNVRGRRVARARRCPPAPDGHRSAVWGGSIQTGETMLAANLTGPLSAHVRLGLLAMTTERIGARAWALFPGDVVYVWHGALHATTVAQSLRLKRLRGSLSGRSGESSILLSAEGIITGNTSRVGMLCVAEKSATGQAIGSS